MSFIPLSNALRVRRRPESIGKGDAETLGILEYTMEVLGEVFSRERAGEARPMFLKNRTLTISCATTEIAQDIRLKQAEILEKINEKLGKKEIDSIRYLA